MASLGQHIFDRKPLPPWSNTRPYQVFAGDITYHYLDRCVSIHTCRAIINYRLPWSEVNVGSHKSFVASDDNIGNQINLVRSTIHDMARIFHIVRELIITNEFFTRKFSQRYCGVERLDLMDQILTALLEPRRFIVEEKHISSFGLAQRQLTPPDNTIWIEFSSDASANANPSITAWANADRGVITLRHNALIQEIEAQRLFHISIHAGMSVDELTNSLTSKMTEQLIFLSIFGPILPFSTRDSQITYPLLVPDCPGTQTLSPASITRFIILSYLQATHPFHDFISSDTITAKNPMDTWSPTAQGFYRRMYGLDPPIPVHDGGDSSRYSAESEGEVRGRAVLRIPVYSRGYDGNGNGNGVDGGDDGCDLEFQSDVSPRTREWVQEREEELWWRRLAPVRVGESSSCVDVVDDDVGVSVSAGFGMEVDSVAGIKRKR